MEEVLCSIEIIKENNDFIAKIQSDLGGNREYRSQLFEDVLDQFFLEVHDELIEDVFE